MISDATAVNFSAKAISDVFGMSGKTGEIAALFGCSLNESGFGYYWHGEGVGSFNQGAIQCGGWTGKRFVYVDTHPNADGTSTKYTACFRAYTTEQAGWDDLVRVMYYGRRARVREAAIAQDWLGVSKAMHDTGYYEGFGKTVADRVANHARAMAKGINRALAVLGENPIGVPPAAPYGDLAILRYGSTVPDVRLLQRELRLAADGIFGKITQKAVLDYQTEHKLVADGVVGPVTWKTLLTDDYVPAAA
jgi:hypothetical protein